MAGRPRKPGLRERSGRVQRISVEAQHAIKLAVVNGQPHRCVVAEKDRLDVRAESLLGRMRLAGELTEPQFQAGLRFATVVQAYRAVIEAPNQSKPSFGGVSGRSELTEAECLQRKQKYDDAFIALSWAGQRAQRAVADVVIYDRPSTWPLEHLMAGLRKLTEHFGMTAKIHPFHA